MLAVIIVISVIGILTIYSATRPLVEEEHVSFYLKQATWLVLGVLALFLVVSFDYIWLSRFSLFLYVIGIVLLIAVFFMGRTGMGAQRWLSLGLFSFQPSEFFKLAYIIMLSQYLSMIKPPLDTPALVRAFFFITFIPFLLLIKQPDLGTALIVLAMFMFLVIAQGTPQKNCDSDGHYQPDLSPVPREYLLGRAEGLPEEQACCLYGAGDRSHRHRISPQPVEDHGRVRERLSERGICREPRGLSGSCRKSIRISFLPSLQRSGVFRKPGPAAFVSFFYPAGGSIPRGSQRTSSEGFSPSA